MWSAEILVSMVDYSWYQLFWQIFTHIKTCEEENKALAYDFVSGQLTRSLKNSRILNDQLETHIGIRSKLHFRRINFGVKKDINEIFRLRIVIVLQSLQFPLFDNFLQHPRQNTEWALVSDHFG